MRLRSWQLWALALVVTLMSAVYQRLTGPTHPARGTVTIGSEVIRFRLPRSYDGADDAEVRIPVASPEVTGSVEQKRYPSKDSWKRIPMDRRDGFLVATLPHQPPSGKVMYRIYLGKDREREKPITSTPLVIRFRGAVPIYILHPHILMMFIGMLCSTRAGLEGMFGTGYVQKLAFWTVVFLAVGGMVLGPIVQKHAFGAYWTGWPLGNDLTDNKTVVAFLLWIAAWLRLRVKPHATAWAVVAAIVLLLVYAIPHSVLGSELDYTKG